MLSKELTPELCAIEVMETVPLVMRFIRAEMRRQGSLSMSVPQFRALAFLDTYPGTSLSELAEHLGVTKATASTALERLVQRGLVNRVNDPKERRRLTLTLTPAGNQLLQRGREAARSYVASVLGELSEAKLLQVAQGMASLGEVFKEVVLPPKN